MKRKTLAMMNGAEARNHYDGVIANRFKKALAMEDAADRAPRKVQAELRRLAKQKLDKAREYSEPCEWQRAEALNIKKRSGKAAAAGFLAAHRWPMDEAYYLVMNDSND